MPYPNSPVIVPKTKKRKTRDRKLNEDPEVKEFERLIKCHQVAKEIYFNSKVDDLIIKKNRLFGIIINGEKIVKTDNLILATGHSARDIYYMLKKKKIKLELKEIAVGVRIEHEQNLINKIQYHSKYNKEYLPPASYNINTKIDGRSIHSFCMCPGGIIAPCATNNDELVTNGWSPSKRDNKNANSGIIVQLKKEDFNYKKYKEFASLEFQKKLERKAYILSDKSQKVPAQRVTDFINDKLSTGIPKTSYLPGTVSVKLSYLFPNYIYYLYISINIHTSTKV